jgi:hypothetical protein
MLIASGTYINLPGMLIAASTEKPTGIVNCCKRMLQGYGRVRKVLLPSYDGCGGCKPNQTWTFSQR